MSNKDDRSLTPQERAELEARKVQLKLDKKSGTASTLDDLKKELGIPEKRKK